MSYRNVDKEAYKKAYAKKKKSKKTSSKLDKIPSGSIDQRVQTYKKRKKKKYTKESMFPKAREEARKNIAKPRPFSVAFRSAKNAGKKTFLWKGKSYHTKTKAELEAGKSEKDKFIRKGKSNIEAAKSKKGFFAKVKSALGGNKDWSPEAVEKRRMEKRVAWMKKRKNQGKSYSAKNLKELEAKLSQ